MLSEREDLIAPHPPHIMRDFMPQLGKFGDLALQDNLQVRHKSSGCAAWLSRTVNIVGDNMNSHMHSLSSRF